MNRQSATGARTYGGSKDSYHLDMAAEPEPQPLIWHRNHLRGHRQRLAPPRPPDPHIVAEDGAFQLIAEVAL